MRRRKLGYTDLELTAIGFGTWAIGGGGWQWAWGPQDDEASIAAIRRGLDLGINWVDCAAAYGLGHAEEVLGQAIKGRQDVIVATKCGLVWDEGKPDTYGRLTAASVRAECEASLRRLGVEAIDLYQIHWPHDEAHLEEGWSTIADLVREGKVRYTGVSNFSVGQMQRIQPIHPIASLQAPYSLVARGIETELLPFCAANNIGIIAYSPMHNGLLTGKVTREWVAALPADDWRRDHNPEFREPALSANLSLLDGLRPIAQGHGKSPGEVAIAWVLRRPEMTTAIVGARSPGQIEGTIGGGDLQLSDADIAKIDGLLAARARALATA
ncbi:MAG: aldo/keto reductase [Anaerolineaceae bacterium]|nr:aldo/keto reductase [Anaerolineaceae bacterium]